MSEHAYFDIEKDGLTYVADKSLEDLVEVERSVHDAFTAMLGKHIKAGKGILSLLPYDADEYPSQRLDVVSVRNKNPVGQEIIDGFATSAYPAYPEMKSQLKRDDNRMLFRFLALGINEGKNYIAALNHDSTINTGVAGAIFTAGIEQGARDLGISSIDYQPRLTVSKLMSRLMIFGQPIPDLLALPGELRMSIPPSESIKKAGIDDLVRVRINTSTKNADEANVPPTTLDVISISGTLDTYFSKFSPKRRGKKPQMHMGPMSTGSKQWLIDANIIPGAVHTANKQPRMKLGGQMLAPADIVDAQRVGLEVQKLATEASGIEHVYHMTPEEYLEAVGSKE